MALLFKLVLMSIVLTACHQQETSSTNEGQEPITRSVVNENTYVKVTASEVEKVENGLYLTVELESAVENLIESDSYFVAFPQTVYSSHNQEYVKVSEERKTEVIDDRKLVVREFYEGEAQEMDGALSFSILVKPNFNQQTVTFDISDDKGYVINDGMILSNIIKEENKLRFTLADVHPTRGISVAMEQEGELIYPLFSKTEDKNSKMVEGEFEFVQAIPDSFLLTISRQQFTDVRWEFPFTVTF